MKINYDRLHWIFMFLILSVFPLNAQNSDVTIVDPTKPGNSIALPGDKFEDSVILIQDFSFINSKNSHDKHVLTIEIINFDRSYKLLPAYNINGIEYCDNGKYNDQVAGDGIFTSVTKHRVDIGKSGVTKLLYKDSSFKFNSEADDLINERNNASRGTGIGFGCKVRFVTCANTNWWNSCWPLSSPCTCVEFYDCEITFKIEF